MSEEWRQLQVALRALGVEDLTPSNAEEVDVCELIQVACGGDHIAVRTSEDVAWHHGIFACGGGPNARVIDNRPDGGVRVRPFKLFMKQAQQAVIVRYDRDSVQRRNYSLWVAGMVAELQPALVYDCEGFATLCRTNMWGAQAFVIDLPWRPPGESCKAGPLFACAVRSKSMV